MSKERVFIFEYVSGGGYNQVDIPNSLFCEGFGMLRSIIEDFSALNFEISTLMDYRILNLASFLKTNIIKPVHERDNFIKIFKKQVKESEYCFIIAPEFNNILYELTKIIKRSKKQLLSIDLDAITLGSSKIRTYDFFKAHEISTPRTFTIPSNNGLDFNFIFNKIKELNSPIIIKPDDGVGAEEIYYFRSENELIDSIDDFELKIDSNRKYIMQNYVKGNDLSVSLIGNVKNSSDQFIFLSMNRQFVNIKNLSSDSEYFGGCTPIEEDALIHEKLKKALNKTDLSIFNGYFGIDLIKSNGTLYFIEINPRLTTSYIGIRNITCNNVAELIFNCHFKDSEIDEIKIQNHSLFMRLELEYMGNKSRENVNQETVPILMESVPEIVTPPISLKRTIQSNKKSFSCFIATKEKNLSHSKIKLNMILNKLKELDFHLIRELEITL
ncbi:MAG: ATP-grasp domain-containing protein [Promethearchaeota archaeon]|nr:MAG: ATP-grasp domain-containing protein [Candidatus Lokiarchaeota archaeon]